MGDDNIIIRGGDRDLWIDFAGKCKKEKKKIWDVLSKLIKEYLDR